MKRSKHTLSHYRLITGNMGDIIPLACVPVLPGDTFQGHTNALVRMSPLNTPVMHPTQVRIHHFFVPNRIIWDGWEDFITGGPDGTDTGPIPTLVHGGGARTLAHSLGLANRQGVEFNALPVYGYNMIYNEYYRDQDLISEVPAETNSVQKCAWEKDYFSVCRPWTQKGPEVIVPIGEEAPVEVRNLGTPTAHFNGGDYEFDSSGAVLQMGDQDPQVPADMFANLSSSTGVSVNDFRKSFALQRYQEARARYGSRFTEYLRYLGVTPADARLDRPEFLGGGTQRLQFSEVLQTAQSQRDDENPSARDDFSVGDLYGHGIAGVRTNRFRKFFQEHGWLYTLMSIRPKTLYVNASQREWFKTTKEDFFQKELVHLGQQEVWAEELYPDPLNRKQVFGYNDRYEEYRFHPSSVRGDFVDTLNAYHMGRDLEEDPVLNESFVECNPSDRIFQVGTENSDSCWIMANNHLVARRLVPKRAYPKIL